MTISRILFDIPLRQAGVAGGQYTDTGLAPNGFLHMINFNPGTGDTGVVCNISWHPRQGDTGDGRIIYTISGVQQKLGATGFFDFPRAAASYVGLDNTGDSGFERWPFTAGDRIKVMFTNDTGLNNFSGRMYFYFSDK